MTTRITTKEILARLEKHEEVCAVRLTGIEKRLDEGSKRFVKIEQYIWGIYALIIASGVVNQLL